MALKTYNPTSPGQRGLVLVDRSELHKGKPEASLLVSGSSVFAGITADMLVVPSIGYSGAAAATWLSYGAQAELGLRF